jgi:hypothetical protein
VGFEIVSVFFRLREWLQIAKMQVEGVQEGRDGEIVSQMSLLEKTKLLEELWQPLLFWVFSSGKAKRLMRSCLDFSWWS